MEIYVLNDYLVTQSGYYNILYHVTSRDLTDGRTDTGGWGSETAKTGTFIQATFARPVYVTSVFVAGGFIPSWGHDLKQGYGKLDLEYSYDNKSWLKVIEYDYTHQLSVAWIKTDYAPSKNLSNKQPDLNTINLIYFYSKETHAINN